MTELGSAQDGHGVDQGKPYPEVTFYTDRHKKSGYHTSLNQFYDSIASNPEWKSKVKLLRQGKAIKDKLPCITGSGTFEKDKTTQSLVNHSSRLVADFDAKGHPGIIFQEIKKELQKDQYTEAVFYSCSGNGLAVFVKIDPSRHLDSFLGLEKYYKENYGLTIDQSCKNVNRLRYISHDPNIFINWDSKTFTQYLPKKEKSVKQTVIRTTFPDREKKYYFNKVTGIIIDKIANAPDGEKHSELLKVSKLAGGYVAQGILSQTEAENLVLTEICKRDLDSEKTAEDTMKASIKHGMQNPVKLEGFDPDWKPDKSTKKNKNNVQMESGEEKTKVEIVEDFLRKNWEFRLNIISNSIEYRPIGGIWKVCNENEIYRQLQRKIKYSLSNLVSLLGSDFVPEYNPIKQFFKSLRWDGKDSIALLASFVETDNRAWFELMLKKYLMRVVRCATENGYYNKQAFVLVHPKQNSGKSTFVRFLCPPTLSDYIAEDIDDTKDGDIALSENLFINLDELAYLSKSETNRLKSKFSLPQIKKRKPYGKKAETFQRIASFLGSTNDQEFLKDSTGNVRWLCFDIREINWDYSKKVDINQIYAQAIELVKNGDFNSGEMTTDELNYSEENNEKFKVHTIERELIEKYFEPAQTGEYMTSTDIVSKINRFEQLEGSRLILSERNRKAIGTALKELGFENKLRKVNGKTSRCCAVRYTSLAKQIMNEIQIQDAIR